MNQKCEICKMFDCGTRCKCKCHFGVTDKIRQDHASEKGGNTKKTIEPTMEGLSALFG